MDILNEFCILLEEINRRLTELKWFYSPRTFIDSKVNIEKLNIMDSSSLEHIIVLDRNIFSRLMNIITEGKSKEGSTKDVAQLILWCAIQNINISPYFALNEYAVGQNSEEKAQYEYHAFDQMFSKIDSSIWLALALGYEQENKMLVKPDKALRTTQFNEKSVDYLANLAALLHFEYVWRTEKDNTERFKSFFQWYYDNMKVSRYMTVYICSVLLGTYGYKLPKKINSNNYEEYISGCKNQAMDMCYLTALSIDRIPYDKYECILVTDDHMLGDIFLKGCFNTSAIRTYERNVKRGRRQISEWVDNLLKSHVEANPDNYMQYCKEIIEFELNKTKLLFQ